MCLGSQASCESKGDRAWRLLPALAFGHRPRAPHPPGPFTPQDPSPPGQGSHLQEGGGGEGAEVGGDAGTQLLLNHLPHRVILGGQAPRGHLWARRAPRSLPTSPGTRQRGQARCFGRGGGSAPRAGTKVTAAPATVLAVRCAHQTAPEGLGDRGPCPGCHGTPTQPPVQPRAAPRRSCPYPQRVDGGFEGPEPRRLLQQPRRRAPSCGRREGRLRHRGAVTRTSCPLPRIPAPRTPGPMDGEPHGRAQTGTAARGSGQRPPARGGEQGVRSREEEEGVARDSVCTEHGSGCHQGRFWGPRGRLPSQSTMGQRLSRCHAVPRHSATAGTGTATSRGHEPGPCRTESSTHGITVVGRDP